MILLDLSQLNRRQDRRRSNFLRQSLALAGIGTTTLLVGAFLGAVMAVATGKILLLAILCWGAWAGYVLRGLFRPL